MTTTTRIGMLVAMVAVAACGKQPVTLKELQVSPAVTEVTEGLTARVAVAAVYSDGNVQDVTAQVEWSTQDAAVAGATGGLVQAGQPGSTFLSASWSGLRTSARVDVLAATLLSMRVVLDAGSVPAGLGARATAYGTFSNGQERVITDAVAWSTSSPAAAVDAAGAVRGLATGQADVVASLNGLNAAAALDVTDALATGLELRDVAASLPLGLSSEFQVWASFTDGSSRNVSNEAAIAVADGAVAAVDGLDGIGIQSAAPKKIRGLAAGATVLSATFAGFEASATVQVTGAVLVSIALTPPHGTVHKGELLYFTAQGTLSNGDVVDVTNQVTWMSASQDVAVVYSFLAKGAILAYQVGEVVISVVDPATQVTGEYLLVVR